MKRTPLGAAGRMIFILQVNHASQKGFSCLLLYI